MKSNAGSTHEENAAAMRMFVELAQVLREAAFAKDKHAGDVGVLLLVFAAVAQGQEEGAPMTAGKLALYLDLSRTTVGRKLERLVELGVVIRKDHHYLLAPQLLPLPPHRIRRYVKVLARAFKVLVPAVRRLSGGERFGVE